MFDRLLPIGVRSVLFGAHQFLIHPAFVFAAWWRLYGFPRDPRLWVAFIVHDLGHFFYRSPNMDGPEGERHVEWGATFMRRHFGDYYGDLCLLHSRFWARKLGRHYSPLCAADKLACGLEPWWLYLPRVVASGEIKEYMSLKGNSAKGPTKYTGEPNSDYVARKMASNSMKDWCQGMQKYCEEWAYTHADGRLDTWTPAVKDGA